MRYGEQTSKETIVHILMRRDKITKRDAWRLVNETQKRINKELKHGNIDNIENVLFEMLGLELDYIYCFLWG